MIDLTPEQRREVHELARTLIEAATTLDWCCDLGEASRVQQAQRLLDQARTKAAAWIIEFDRRVNAPLEA